MTWSDLLPPLACAALALVALPFARARRVMLAVLSRLVPLALFAAVVACGAFAAAPDAAPAPLSSLTAALAPADRPALGWPALAGLCVLALLPALLHLDYARRLPAHSALIDELRRELHGLARDVTAPAPAPPRGQAVRQPSEVAAALDTLRNLAGAPRRPAPDAPTLVLDLHQETTR